jgi:hypothetical protein
MDSNNFIQNFNTSLTPSTDNSPIDFIDFVNDQHFFANYLQPHLVLINNTSSSSSSSSSASTSSNSISNSPTDELLNNRKVRKTSRINWDLGENKIKMDAAIKELLSNSEAKKVKIKSIAEMYGVNQTCLRRRYTEQLALLSGAKNQFDFENKRRGPKPLLTLCGELRLFNFIKLMYALQITLESKQLYFIGEFISTTCECPDFKANDIWLSNFLKRHDIQAISIVNEKIYIDSITNNLSRSSSTSSLSSLISLETDDSKNCDINYTTSPSFSLDHIEKLQSFYYTLLRCYVEGIISLQVPINKSTIIKSSKIIEKATLHIINNNNNPVVHTKSHNNANLEIGNLKIYYLIFEYLGFIY